MRVHQRHNESMYAFMDRVLTLIDKKRHLTQTLLGLDRSQWEKVLFVAVLKGMPKEAAEEALSLAMLNAKPNEEGEVRLAVDLEEGWLEEVIESTQEDL